MPNVFTGILFVIQNESLEVKTVSYAFLIDYPT